MASPADLSCTLPQIKDIQMQAPGYGVWVSWSGEEDSRISQLMDEYGGVFIETKANQALWFFFDTNVYLGIAKVRSWSRFSQVAFLLQIFTAKLIIGRNGEKGLVFGESIRSQKVEQIGQSQIWIHPNAIVPARETHGLLLKSGTLLPGMSDEAWEILEEVDTRLPYQCTHGWYVILSPVTENGANQKRFQTGWRDFFPYIEAILQRNKIRYTMSDFFLMFPLDGVRQLRSWCKDYLQLVDRLQKEKPEDFWPCVSAVTDKKGLPFDDTLPSKLKLDWKQLVPDFIHMTKSNALVIGKEFGFFENRFSQVHNAPEDWCSVFLVEMENLIKATFLPSLVPSFFLGSHPHCFYCGQRSHEAKDCPTRKMDNSDTDVWHQVSFLDFTAMREAVTVMNETLENADQETFQAFLKEPIPASYLVRATYHIGWAGQLRAVPFFWQAKDKDLDNKTKQAKVNKNLPGWGALETFTQKDADVLEKELTNLATQTIRDYQVYSLRGFASMEKGNLDQAINYWIEAERTSSFPVIAAWHSFLQARAYECKGELDTAARLYDQIVRSCPTWSFALYRKVVCEVKRGFFGQALVYLNKIVMRDGNFFNKVLLDPELERGHIQIFSHLVSAWYMMEEKAKEEESRLNSLKKELATWFDADYTFATNMAERIDMILQVGRVNNFVTLQAMATGRVNIEKDLHDFINTESIRIKQEFEGYGKRLQKIRNEAAWFPFPRFLTEFNNVFNLCVTNTNWVYKANLGVPESFKRAQKLEETIQEKVDFLEGRMRTLCMIRDSTLFVLVLLETFFWIEFIGAILIFIILPLILLYGGNIGMDWMADMIVTERATIQKVLFMLLSVCAIGIAGMRTVLRFESIREKVLRKAQEGPRNKKKRPVKKKK